MGDCSFRHCQSLATFTSTVIHPAKLKTEKRLFCKRASYLARKWDLLIAYYYFKSGLAASIHLSLEYSFWNKAGNFVLKGRCATLYPILSCLFFFFCASKNNIPLYSNDVQAKLLFLLQMNN